MNWTTGDTGPPIAAVIPVLDYEGNETAGAANLTGATINFQMTPVGGKKYEVNQPADIVGDPTNGTVQYDWAANDLGRAGDYYTQWEVTFPDLTVQTTSKETITIDRQ